MIIIIVVFALGYVACVVDQLVEDEKDELQGAGGQALVPYFGKDRAMEK